MGWYRIWKYRYIALRLWYIDIQSSVNISSTQKKSPLFLLCGNINTIIWLKTGTYILKLYNKHSYVCNIHVDLLDILRYTIHQCYKSAYTLAPFNWLLFEGLPCPALVHADHSDTTKILMQSSHTNTIPCLRERMWKPKFHKDSNITVQLGSCWHKITLLSWAVQRKQYPWVHATHGRTHTHTQSHWSDANTLLPPSEPALWPYPDLTYERCRRT